MTKYFYTKTSATLALLLGTAAFTAHAQTGAVLTPKHIETRYDAAKKRCDALSGKQKDSCIDEAEANRDAAEAQAAASKKKAEADRDAAKAHREADYDLAVKKCAPLSGDAQDKCEADAKAQYGK